MATPARLDRLPAKESHGTALQESLRRYPMAVCVSVWHFGLTRSKNRALNSPVSGTRRSRLTSKKLAKVQLRVWPNMKRPFIRLDSRVYCFDIFSLFDNIY